MIDLNTLELPDLFASLTAGGEVDRLLEAAFAEDVGDIGDITSQSILPADRSGTAVVASRQSGVIAGLAIVPAICRRFGHDDGCRLLMRDGERCQPGSELATLTMPLRDLLTLERTMLNIVGRLSGIATLTRQYVDAIAGTKAVICDTRKTTPGMRTLEKYATRCGGGTLHRIGLFDALLYKDNHLAHLAADELAHALQDAITTARARYAMRFAEVEVDSLEQLAAILPIAPGLIDIVLLDNMPADVLRQAVAMRNAQAPQVLLEASGGINLQTVRPIAESGVDRISVGAITHSAPCLDVGLDIRV